MNQEVIDWLLEGPAWIKYAVELQLLDRKPDLKPVLEDGNISEIVQRLKGADVGLPALKTGRVHYTETGKAYWDLFLLADIGLTVNDLRLEDTASGVFRFQSPDGTFTIPPNVKPDYFCMSAILVASLARMGYSDDPRIGKYIRAALQSQVPRGGWDCYNDGVSYLDACPMDNLNILMLLGQYQQYREDPGLFGAIDLLLAHWDNRQHLFGFGIGRRFRNLQYPAVKYGILRVLDVLSLFPHATGSPRFADMLEFVRGKGERGKYFAEAPDAAYHGLDFAQTEQPSRWITFLINRIERRAGIQ